MACRLSVPLSLVLKMGMVAVAVAVAVVDGGGKSFMGWDDGTAAPAGGGATDVGSKKEGRTCTAPGMIGGSDGSSSATG